MPEAGFFEQKKISPTSLVIVVTLHAAAITALALSKMEMPSNPFTRTEVKLIPLTPDPPPEPVDTPKAAPKARIVVTLPQPKIQPPIQRDVQFEKQPEVIPPRLPDLSGNTVTRDPPVQREVVADPVRIEAQMHPRSELQPPYPASEQRAGTEGQVRVRVLIGSDGRVKAIEKVSATNDAFYRSTERHARRGWRFKPATIDGRPVESRKVVTVNFQLNG
jgi:periplasmic protein TonB